VLTPTSVQITNLDFTDLATVQKFLRVTGPLGGFFNLGMVLADGLFTKMTGSQWDAPLGVKMRISRNFSQAMGSDTHFFVTYSSVSAGVGNAGQSNYGYANSALDKLVQERSEAGRCSLSIQWGAIGDVGVLSRVGAKKTGTVSTAFLPQEIDSCLKELEKLLVLQAQGTHMVYVSPKRGVPEGGTDSGSHKSVIERVCGIIGVANPDSLRDSETLENLGVDSLQFMEIQNAIKKATDSAEKMPVEKLGKMSVKELRGM